MLTFISTFMFLGMFLLSIALIAIIGGFGWRSQDSFDVKDYHPT
jgi:hypothetical protein